jgi:hypothetical protein
MSYHDLSECTLTAEERCVEAARIIRNLEVFSDDLTPKEKNFVGQMDGAGYVSVKQLFYLRDINGKY